MKKGTGAGSLVGVSVQCGTSQAIGAPQSGNRGIRAQAGSYSFSARKIFLHRPLLSLRSGRCHPCHGLFQVEGDRAGVGYQFPHATRPAGTCFAEVAQAKEVKFSRLLPFTEPSVEMHVRHPKLGWMELGGRDCSAGHDTARCIGAGDLPGVSGWIAWRWWRWASMTFVTLFSADLGSFAPCGKFLGRRHHAHYFPTARRSGSPDRRAG